MSRVLLRLNGHEAKCVYASVFKELRSLEEELASGNIAPEDVANAQRSVDTCKSLLSKLSADGSVYRLTE